MRIFVLFLAMLAGSKVWVQDTLFRSGAEEALVAAYRDRAIQACQRQPSDSEGRSARGLDWSQPETIRLSTGSRAVSAYFWQVDHANWNARYRNPYLVLTAREDAGGPRCEYDVLYGQAKIVRA
jgi:hypothetical protein